MGSSMDNKQTSSTETDLHKPSLTEKVIGILFAFLVFALISFVILSETSVDQGKMNLLYVLIALMSGIFAATIPGFLNIDYSTKGMTMRAAGGLAAFVIVLFSLNSMSQPSASPAKAAEQQEQQAPAALFYATSYCSMRDVYGYANHNNVTTAQNLAVQNCINNGGIPDCCAGNVRVSQ